MDNEQGLIKRLASAFARNGQVWIAVASIAFLAYVMMRVAGWTP